MGDQPISLNCPETMWVSASDTMKIPPALVEAYSSLITASGLEDLAKQPRPADAPVGGPSQEATDEHFVHAFDGSVARIQLAYLDIGGQLPTTSGILQRFLTGGHLCIADVPCGAGAASLALLCTIAELRKHKKLPCIPLYVHVIGGEISAPARFYANNLLSSIEDHLAEQSIFLTKEIIYWDVLDELSNTKIIEKIILSDNSRGQILVIVSNFNSFLTRNRKKDQALPQIKELFRYCSGKTNAGVWIEPDMNKAKIELFPWLRKVAQSLNKFVQLSDPHADETSLAKFEIPLFPPKTATVRIRTVSMDFIRGGNS